MSKSIVDTFSGDFYKEEFAITNNSNNDLLLCVKMYEVRTETFNRLGTIMLPSRKSHILKNFQMDRIFVVSIGIMTDKLIGTICYDVPIFDNLIITNDYKPLVLINLQNFEDFNGTDDCEDDCEENNPDTHFKKDTKIVGKIINNTSKSLLCIINIQNLSHRDEYESTIGWIYLPSNTSYPIINYFTKNIMLVTAGFLEFIDSITVGFPDSIDNINTGFPDSIDANTSLPDSINANTSFPNSFDNAMIDLISDSIPIFSDIEFDYDHVPYIKKKIFDL